MIERSAFTPVFLDTALNAKAVICPLHQIPDAEKVVIKCGLGIFELHDSVILEVNDVTR